MTDQAGTVDAGSPPAADPVTPFHDLGAFVSLARCAGLALSPDGTRLVTAVGRPDAAGTRYRSALWEVDPAGARPARRLTRGDPGETDAVFLPDGDLLFLSGRPDPDGPDPDGTDPDGQDPDDPPAALWRLPAAGGEPTLLGTRSGGCASPVVAREAGTVVCLSDTLPGTPTGDDDAEQRRARRTAKVTAVLHDGHPVRFWDHELGPDRPRLLAAPCHSALGAGPTEERLAFTDLTGDAGLALHDVDLDVTPDGSTVVTVWQVAEPGGATRGALVAFDLTESDPTGSGTAGRTGRRVLLDDADHTVAGPVAVSPDGRWVACLRERRTSATDPPVRRCVVVPLHDDPPAAGPARTVAPAWDSWITAVAWTPDAAALVVAADDHGRGPLFRVDLADAAVGSDAGGADTGGSDKGPTDTVTRLTGDHGAYAAPVVAPDGTAVYALRSAVDAPPAPVRLDPRTPDQTPTPLPGPRAAPRLPGTLTEVTATAADGTALRAWLVLPDGASVAAPAPLLLWVHGGPLSSWNAWHWRWNPWVMAAHGYAVLLPDPALSTGYGHAFLARGWGRWGAEPYTDLMAVTDAAVALPAVDAARTAVMGGSFGGYMANWIAGHTDRFAAIVTHASLWALDQFVPTTDLPAYWLREMTPAMRAAHSPHHHADAIITPMLVVHGDRDHRVPMGEALRLWWDLVSRHPGPPDTLPHRFLSFPDENHWVLRPSNAQVWYATVLAFLDHHVRGAPWGIPTLLS